VYLHASSRVGAMTMARGALTGRFAAAGSVSSRLNRAMRKAAVLPVPSALDPPRRGRRGLPARFVPEWGCSGYSPVRQCPVSRIRRCEGFERELTEMGV